MRLSSRRCRRDDDDARKAQKFFNSAIFVQYGQIMHVESGLCLDAGIVKIGEIMVAGTCSKRQLDQQWKFDHYYYSVDKFGQLRKENECAAVVPAIFIVEMVSCNTHFEPTKWILSKYGQIMHVHSGLCLDASRVKIGEVMQARNCSINTPDQQWIFDHYA
ncbi:hypothetical protein TSAR_011405 [Trichomalopsis sarcophagae]|uniref:Ricin B lectin domain-containing protein n=1 Tax=Trichomalopsis sarcophagae TaxID=543379 RepID=A0A232EFU3_9HYME|nr:hypothetical protein TSAR_011405 [Trichomalopsis sarcophagae]